MFFGVGFEISTFLDLLKVSLLFEVFFYGFSLDRALDKNCLLPAFKKFLGLESLTGTGSLSSCSSRFN